MLLLDDNPALYHEREILRYADVVSPDSCRNGLCGDSEQVGCTERGNDFGLERPSGFFVLIRSSISLVVLGLDLASAFAGAHAGRCSSVVAVAALREVKGH